MEGEIAVVYAVAEAEPSRERPQRLVPWTGTRRGQLVGVLTDPPGHALGPFSGTPSAVLLHHLASIQKMLMADEVSAITGLSARNPEPVLDELAGQSFGRANVSVDGEPVVADTITYRGLQFALGHDVARFSFVVVRQADASGDWPALVTERP